MISGKYYGDEKAEFVSTGFAVKNPGIRHHPGSRKPVITRLMSVDGRFLGSEVPSVTDANWKIENSATIANSIPEGAKRFICSYPCQINVAAMACSRLSIAESGRYLKRC